jgi:signal peptidase I
MYTTLHDGDSVILWMIGYTPSAFDVVVFEPEEDMYYVKRIIGLPGQSIKYENDQLYIDGRVFNGSYLEKAKASVASNSLMPWDFNSGLFTENFTLQDICDINGFTDCHTIAARYYLTLGDNRPNSRDSRHIGLINEEQILGRGILIQWPINRFGGIE